MNKFTSIKSASLVLAATVMFSSCATIVSGGNPTITINGDSSKPVTIKTDVNTYENLYLPAKVKVSRHAIDGQRVQITSEGEKYKDIILEKQVNGWAFGNVILGGLIGLGIDLITNCVSKPAQTKFDVQPISSQNK